MDDQQRFQHFLRGGMRDKSLGSGWFIGLVSNVVDVLLYKKIQIQHSRRRIDLHYKDNKIFWQEALRKRHFQGMRIQLQGFHLTEWLPSAPGRFFLETAEQLREDAENFSGRRGMYDGRYFEYSPDIKSKMIFGGIGSIRLQSSYNSINTLYFLGASSTGVSHQGIPIVLEEKNHFEVIRTIHEYGGCFVNLVGTLQFLPSLEKSLHYDRGVPKYCLVLDEVEILYPSPYGELSSTIAIAFLAKKSTTIFEKSWSFCSFNPSSIEDFNRTISWLQDYARRYSDLEKPLIFADFDAHYQHFDNPVEFPLSKVWAGKIDVTRFKEYEDYYNINFDKKNVALLNVEESLRNPQIKRSPSYLAVNIFISYVHEDEELLKQFKKQLIPFERQGLIRIWDDRQIDVGQKIKSEIDQYLNSAQIILLLVSADFIASDYCYNVEMKQAMERHTSGKAQVIPIILRSISWKDTPFGMLRALPANGKPVTDSSWYNLDEAFFAIAESIRRIVEQFPQTLLGRPTSWKRTQSNFTSVLQAKKFILLRTLTDHLDYLRELAMSPDGKTLISVSFEKTVVWSIQTGQALYTLKDSHAHDVAVIAGGQKCVTRNTKQEVNVWDLKTGQLLNSLKGNTGGMEMAVSADGEILASSDYKNVVVLWSISTGEQIRTFADFLEDVESLTISPDKQLLICGIEDGTIKLFKIDTGELYATLGGHHLGVKRLAISSSGRFLAVSGFQSIKLWDLHTLELIHTFTTHSLLNLGIGVSLDEQVLISAGGISGNIGSSAELWSITTGQRLHTFASRIKGIHCAAIGLDGYVFIGGGSYSHGGTGTIEVWKAVF